MNYNTGTCVGIYLRIDNGTNPSQRILSPSLTRSIMTLYIPLCLMAQGDFWGYTGLLSESSDLLCASEDA